MANSTEEKYFDLHVTGIGYLNRVREVPVKRGQPFLAVDVAALHGAADQVEKTWFDCRVSGAEAQQVVQSLMADIQAEKSVLVGFKLGDLYAETFVYRSGAKAGQTGVSLKARLLRIAWAKVDGKEVYRAPERAPEAASPEPPRPAASRAPAHPHAPAEPVPSACSASAEAEFPAMPGDEPEDPDAWLDGPTNMDSVHSFRTEAELDAVLDDFLGEGDPFADARGSWSDQGSQRIGHAG